MLTGVQQLLGEPNDKSPANAAAYKMFTKQKAAYAKCAPLRRPFKGGEPDAAACAARPARYLAATPRADQSLPAHSAPLLPPPTRAVKAQAKKYAPVDDDDG